MSNGYITAVDVRNALMRRFSDSRRYAIAEEVGITTGDGCRRPDMIVMDCYWSNDFRIDGFEIKISTLSRFWNGSGKAEKVDASLWWTG